MTCKKLEYNMERCCTG